MAVLGHQYFLKLLFIGLELFTVTIGYEVIESNQPETYTIEGKVFPPDTTAPNTHWQTDTTVYLKGGYHIGYLK